MRSKLFLIILVLMLVPIFNVHAQNTFDTKGFPQWAKDLRRWEIIAFGSFPFTVFFSTFGMDTYRWGKESGFSDMRYAPWPLKSAGAVEMTNDEYKKTLLIAAGASAVIAVVDLIIVQTKRAKSRRIAESIPVGTITVTKKPWPPVPETENETDASGETASQGDALSPNEAAGSSGEL